LRKESKMTYALLIAWAISSIIASFTTKEAILAFFGCYIFLVLIVGYWYFKSLEKELEEEERWEEEVEEEELEEEFPPYFNI